MKYRQWKKNYKKKHGVNPPLELDKRKQRRLARKMARQINETLPTAAETLTAAINRWAQSIKPALATLCENVAAAFTLFHKGDFEAQLDKTKEVLKAAGVYINSIDAESYETETGYWLVPITVEILKEE